MGVVLRITQRKHRTTSIRPVFWGFFVLGVLSFTWGCQTGQRQRRAQNTRDSLPFDQYDDTVAPRDNRGPSRSSNSRFSDRHQGSWLDGESYRNPTRRAQPLYTRRKVQPFGQHATMDACMQQRDIFAQRQCLEPLLLQGTPQVQQKRILYLLNSGSTGARVYIDMLRKGRQAIRTSLVRNTLQGQIYRRSRTLVYALFKFAKQDFLEALTNLTVPQRIEVGTMIAKRLSFFTRKRITQQFGPYLKVPAHTLWDRIQKETGFSSSMAMVSLSGCTQGTHTTPKLYSHAMLSLERYFTTWRIWNAAVRVSGIRRYLKQVRAYKRGQLRYRPRPRINRKALRAAIFLARKLNMLKPITARAIDRVPSSIPRARMQSWYNRLLRRSPRPRKKKSPYRRKRSGGKPLTL